MENSKNIFLENVLLNKSNINYICPNPKLHHPYASVALIIRLILEKSSQCYEFENIASVLDYVKQKPLIKSEVLFIKRSINERDRWSGQIAFPGGKGDDNESPLETAVRECKEEVGLELSPEFFMVLGQLEPRAVRKPLLFTAKFSLHPFVFLQIKYPPEGLPLQINPSEVAIAWWVSTDILFGDNASKDVLEFELSTYLPSLRKSKILQAIAWILRAKTIKFPCIYLGNPKTPPHLAGPASQAVARDRDYVLWGLTLGVVNDVSRCCGFSVKASSLKFSINFLVDSICLVILKVVQ